MVDETNAVWKKSTRSGDSGNCVEVADLRAGQGVVLVRDSKDPNGPRLTFTTAEWAAFTGGVQDGELV